jgi:hypothetical protein
VATTPAAQPTPAPAAQTSSVPAAAQPAPSSASCQGPLTRLQQGIRKPKLYIDGTIHYGHLASSCDESFTLKQALCDKNWKHTMDVEVDALHKNKTWHLVPPSRERML